MISSATTFMHMPAPFPWTGVIPASANAASLARSAATDEEVVSEPTDVACWRTGISTMFTMKGRPMEANPAVRFASPVDDAVEETEVPRADLPEWGNTKERMRETLAYVVHNFLDGDVNGITAGGFLTRRFIIPSGEESTGGRLLRAVAKLERPEMKMAEAYNAITPHNVARIAREKYLSELHYAQDWGSTYERLKDTLRYVLDDYLGNDLNMITSSPKFIRAEFVLPSGERVTGGRLLRAVANLERPDMSATRAYDSINNLELVRIVREKYLHELNDEQDWGSTYERLSGTLHYVVQEYLDGDVNGISTNAVFQCRMFQLPSGLNVSGQRLLVAVASLERPEMAAYDAYKAIRGRVVVQITKEKYLADLYQDWGGTVERMRKTLSYVVRTYLDDDVSRVTCGIKFRGKAYKLPSGEEVSGVRLLNAVAKLERPEMDATEAYRAIGGSEVGRIAREKYLSELHDEQDWGSTLERLRETLRYVVENYLDGDANMIKAGHFMDLTFTFPSGKRVSAFKLLSAVAKLEKPEVSTWKAYHSMGGKEAARLAREKYFFILDDTPESFVKAIKMMMDDDENGGDA